MAFFRTTVPSDDEACFIANSDLFAELVEANNFDHLAKELKLKGRQSNFRHLSGQEQVDALVQRADQFSKDRSTPWYGCEASEVLAGNFWRSKAPAKYKKKLWAWRRREQDLVGPLARWLLGQGYRIWLEVPLGSKRADLIAWRKRNLLRLHTTEKILAFELKNSLTQFDRGLSQMATYNVYAHGTFMVCTPYLAMEYVDKYARSRAVRHWDTDFLTKKLEGMGLGLLFLSEDEPKCIIDANATELEDSKREQLMANLAKCREITTP